jgi:predicted negative regulator of RcsB-dependent stress response
MRKKHEEKEAVYHPEAAETSHERLLQHLRDVTERYSWHILVAAVAIAVAVVGWRGYRGRLEADERATWSQLAGLPEVSPWMPAEDAKKLRTEVIRRCEDLLQNNWKTSATPWVVLRLAREELSAGNARDAARHARRLVEEYAEAPAGKLAGRLYGCALEEQKEFRAAGEWFSGQAGRMPEAFRATLLWDAARNYEAAGMKDEARAACEKLLALGPEPELERLAQWRLSAMALEREPVSLPEPEAASEPEKAEEPQKAEEPAAEGTGEEKGGE